MKFKNILCGLTSLITMSLVGAQAATYYVATTGSDSNPGTSASPFRTITYAYSHASAGTTILVASGTYTDYQSGWGLHLNKSGTSSSPIILKSQVRGGAILDGQFGSDRHDGIYLDGSYNVIDGFGITRAPITGVFIMGDGNKIINDEIYNNSTQGSSDPEGQGIYSDQNTANNIYENNYIHDNGYAGSNLDHGLYLCGQNEVVANNVVVRHPSRGLQIAGYVAINNIKVYNNVFAWNGKHGITVWMAMNGADIRNNICYGNGLYGIEFYAATGSGVTVDHNLVYGNGSGNYSFTDGGSTVGYTLGTTISSDPKLANETQSGFDAHLTSGSPAIGAGLNFYSTFTTDMTGAARPSSGAWDIGSYISGSSSSGDTTPPTVSLTAPISGAMVSGTAVAVSANAADNVAVASVQLKLDGANLGSALTTAPYAGMWNSTTIANGSHALTAVATDTAGNQTTSAAMAVSVNNLLPTVALTAPVNGSSYSAPATINLAASVNANGHTITAVKFYNGSTLLGQSTAAPYTYTWNNLPAAMYGVSATAVYDLGLTVASPSVTVTVTNPVVVSGLTFAATSGAISAPFFVTNNNAIVQPAYTTMTAGGQAVYTFNVTAAGNYVVNALVDVPSTDNNSFFVNIDAQPTDPTMIWDIPTTSGMASQTVSWRGNGGVDANSPSGMDAQFAPQVFNLSAGTHQLIVRGREGLVQLGTITIAPYGSVNTPPTITAIADQTITAGSSTGTLAFTVGDAQIAAGSLTVTASSSNSTLVPNANIVLGGSGANRTVAVTPAGSQTGTATITLTVSDGTLSTSTSFSVTVNATTSGPVVSVAATTPNASRVGPVSGVFTLTRTGSTSAALTVDYSLAGTAANGTDYNSLATSLTIPAGAASATLTVTPKSSASDVGTETAVLTLSANSAYTAGSASSGTVTIAGNSVPSTIGNAPGHNVKVTWTSVAGKIYRVAYKSNLSDATWTDLSGLITATGTSTSYTDTTASNKTQRYYVVYVTN
jgi:hypothetical protein